MWIRQYAPVSVICGKHETESVRLAVENLKRDLRRVLNCQLEEGLAEGVLESEKADESESKKECEPENGKEGASENEKEGVSEIGKGVPGREQENPPGAVLRIIVGTTGQTDEIVHDAGLERLRDEEGNLRKEAFLLQEKNGELFIVGSDRQGTIYGIYEFCEKWLGVSPWYFFADVPVRAKQEVEIPSGFVQADWPSVEYRGIFINDEEELEHWVQRYMGEPTIGVKTYEKIFELLLRLKMNYIWPAMHVNSFNAVRENGALADRMGIVVGTSHCDMLMRSNNREWYPWLRKKGYTDAVYDFSLPGRNREILKEYWRESIEQNRDFEVSYTLGMRGIHDSGFEVRALEGKTGRELLEAKIELLDSVIKTQEELLRENLGKETVKTFVPYKEVLELYDNGLEVPEDLTLIWVNDNYGYVRRYPGEKEKRRRGGNGLYYHNSYWAPPGGSYLFICSIPLSHTRNELKKAYEEGIRKIWVTNFGAMKPLEQQMSFYAAYAWEAGREGALTEDEQAFLRQWIDRTFSGGYGAELAPILTEFDQLTNARKVEQMDFDAFSQTAWGDEAAGRIHRYEEMFAVVNRIWKSLPEEEQDAFFQMIGMKVHAAYYTNLMYYYADRSNLCMAQGKKKAARKYTDLCREFDHARRSMLHYYNHVMAGGKWNGILTPEDFPPPRTAMHPACMPPVGELSPVEEILSAEDTLEYMPLNGDALSSGEELSAEEIPLAGKGPREGGDGSEGGKVGAEGSRKCNFIVTKWNDGQEIVFTQPAVKWIEIGNEGNAPVKYRLSGPDWIRFADVDKIYLRLPHMEAGTHRITFHAMSRYFAFTRFVIYTGERRENSLGREGGDQRLPQAFDIRGFVEENYGKEAVSLLPRPVLYLPENPRGGTLDAEDIMVQPSAWGKPVKAEELVESGRSLPGEKDGRLLIECGAALADTAFARMENYRWQWCASPSHGETGLALYIREYGKHWTDAADAPALRYLFRVQGGNYNIWIRAMMWGDDTCHFTIGLDGELVPESTLYGGRGIWRYSNEQVWKWIPVWKAQLTEGEHELRIVTFSSRLRFEQVYITDGGELPPALG